MEDLPKCSANYAPLSPIAFLERTALIHPTRTSIVYGLRQRYTWSDTFRRSKQLASALLRAISFPPGSTVSVLAPNVPAMYEAHFGIPMARGVINCINIRLDARTVSLLLDHSATQAVLVDREFFPLLDEAFSLLSAKHGHSFKRPLIVVIEDNEITTSSSFLSAAILKGAVKYEDFLLTGDENFAWMTPEDEWESISLGYTSGTTSNPKGVVLSHRGAYLSSLAACLVWGLKEGCIYLWTLPLFHCNGWCYSWAVAAMSGTNVCLRQVTAKSVYAAIAEHGVTHFCAAPIVLNTILNALPEERVPIKPGVQVMTAGAAPPAAVLAKMEGEGFKVTHTYGLTETYGPCTVCEWKHEWDPLPLEERARLKARQGVRYVAQEGLDVVDPDTMAPVPADGKSIGEIVMRGNMVMKGYLKNPQANEECFKGGWFHSGDLGVKHTDGYIEIKDRSKDIIISGGENISSLEVESILYRHPLILEASVVARPDEIWGESPCAFVTLKEDAKGKEKDSENSILEFCRANLAYFMVPKSVVFGPLPKTATGKIQKHVLRERARLLGPLGPTKARSRL